MDEHGTKPDQPMYQHLTNCAQFAEYLKFYALPGLLKYFAYFTGMVFKLPNSNLYRVA